MATYSSIGTSVPNNPYAPTIPVEPPILMDGLVRHALLTASVQVRILSIVDETGTATIGDIVAELSDHPDPVGAVLVMVDLEILVLEVRGVVDHNTVVRRGAPGPDPLDTAGGAPIPSGGTSPDLVASADRMAVPGGLERLTVTSLSTSVVIGAGDARRDFARLAELRRPGVYGLLNGTHLYVGTGCDVGLRVATGQQPIEDIETIFVITDANGGLTEEDARAAERILWSRAEVSRERSLVNALPDGFGVTPERYSAIETFIAQACLALRHNGVLFTSGSTRSVLAGPRQEPGRVGPMRPLNVIPDGQILELNFGAGLVALASRQTERRWVLLQGSDVRIGTVASASSSVRYLRSAWLHSGLLDVSPDGRSYMTTRDLVFGSGSAVAQFCAGSKGRTLESWRPIDPDGGYDPDTAALIGA